MSDPRSEAGWLPDLGCSDELCLSVYRHKRLLEDMEKDFAAKLQAHCPSLQRLLIIRNPLNTSVMCVCLFACH